MGKRCYYLMLLSILSLAFYMSCNNNDESEKYLDNKLIEGKWIGLYAKDSMVYTFENNNATYELYAFVQGMDTLKYQGKDDYGNYLLTDSLILLSKASNGKWIYKLNDNNDSLYIRNPSLWLGFKRLKK